MAARVTAPFLSSSAEKWPGWRRFWPETSTVQADTSRVRPLKIHPLRITTIRRFLAAAAVVSRHLSAGRIFLCPGDLDIFYDVFDPPLSTGFESTGCGDVFTARRNLRDKDEAMIDRRRGKGALNHRVARWPRDNIIFLYPVDTNTA